MLNYVIKFHLMIVFVDIRKHMKELSGKFIVPWSSDVLVMAVSWLRFSTNSFFLLPPPRLSLEIMVQLPFSLHAIIVAPFVKQSFSRQFTARIHCNDSQAKTTNCSWLQKKRKEGSASPSPTFTSLLRVERLNVFKKKMFQLQTKNS